MQSKALMMRGPAQLFLRIEVEKRVPIVEKNCSPVKQESMPTLFTCADFKLDQAAQFLLSSGAL